MPSAEKTANYGLNQWAGNEYPKRQDFVDDNAKIDAELKKAQDHRENTSNPHKVMADQVGAINPNLLINGDFQVWQRGISFTGTGTAQYCADRWASFDITGKQGIHVEKSDEGLQFSNSIDPSHVMGISQTLESDFVQKLAGETVTFSARVKASQQIDNLYIRIKSSNSGVLSPAGTPTDYEQKIVSVGTEFQTFSLTWNIPDDVKGLEFSIMVLELPDTETTVTINWAKVEIGSVATEFSPRSYAEELAMCQRYYYNPYSSDYNSSEWTHGALVCGGSFRILIPTPVTMRTNPSLDYLYGKTELYNRSTGEWEQKEIYSTTKMQSYVTFLIGGDEVDYLDDDESTLARFLPALDAEIY